MTNETQTTTETPTHAHFELPKALDPALNFWAVFLRDEDGTRYAGPTPALPVWQEKAYMVERGSYEGDVPLYATNGPEFARMENKKPKVERDARGRVKTRRCRGWHDAHSKTKVYFEDPDVIATSSRPGVIDAMLFCPNLGPAGMGQEPHGVYIGVGQSAPPNMPGTPGQCPKCGDDPIQRARAIRFAHELWQRSSVSQHEPSALKQAFAEIEGGNF